MKKAKKGLMLSMLLVFAMMILTACGSRKENTVFSVDDLEGKKIGVQLGTTGDIYASDYEGDAAGTVVERYNKGADAIQALKQGKIDSVIIDEQPAKAFTAKNRDLMILDEEFANEDYAIAIAKSNTELKAKINSALAQLKSEGTIDKIIGNYIGDTTKGSYTYVSPDNVVRSNGTIVMATNAAFPPYEYYENNKIIGIDADMMQAVADKLGMDFRIEDMEFDSIINAVQSGKADVGVAGMTVTEDRLKSIDFSDSYTTAKQVIVVRDNDYEGAVADFGEKLYDNFVKEGRWKYLAQGLVNTLIIALCAAVLGIIAGFLIAIVRAAHDKNGSLKVLNAICKVYLTIIRGTPVMVQLLIIYYVIFQSVSVSKVIVAIIAFAINSAAYVAEIVRSGIMSIDNGQFEAGRSLGFTFNQTMRFIIIPQAFKNVLPALANEFIALLKETSVAGYIGLVDLTRGGDIIRSITYEAFLPLIAVALVYLVLVMALTAGVNKLERSLKKNER